MLIFDTDTDIFLLNIVCFSTYFGYNFSLRWVKGSIANCFLHVPPKYSREMINASSARYHVAQTCPPLSMAPPTLHFSKKFHSFIFQIYISDSTLSSSSISQCSSSITQTYFSVFRKHLLSISRFPRIIIDVSTKLWIVNFRGKSRHAMDGSGFCKKVFVI
jgi:hypothetical protein